MTKNLKSPTQIPRSPTKIPKLPTQTSRSSTKIPKFPMQTPRLPTKILKLPTHMPKSPTQMLRSPTQTPKSPTFSSGPSAVFRDASHGPKRANFFVNVRAFGCPIRRLRQPHAGWTFFAVVALQPRHGSRRTRSTCVGPILERIMVSIGLVATTAW